MPDRPPRAPSTPAAPATSSRPHLLRPSTIAASAKRAIPQRPKRAKPKRTTQQAKKTASSILTPKYVESSASEEEEKEEENEPSRGEFTLGGRVFRRATDFASRRKRKKTSHLIRIKALRPLTLRPAQDTITTEKKVSRRKS
jgi:membrane carboxypeptidase/penicillin-binding protein PbpC